MPQEVHWSTQWGLQQFPSPWAHSIRGPDLLHVQGVHVFLSGRRSPMALETVLSAFLWRRSLYGKVLPLRQGH